MEMIKMRERIKLIIQIAFYLAAIILAIIGYLL